LKQAIENKYIVDWFITPHYTNMKNNLLILKSNFKLIERDSWSSEFAVALCLLLKMKMISIIDNDDNVYWYWLFIEPNVMFNILIVDDLKVLAQNLWNNNITGGKNFWPFWFWVVAVIQLLDMLISMFIK
jgi:hypothetical protein